MPHTTMNENQGSAKTTNRMDGSTSTGESAIPLVDFAPWYTSSREDRMEVAKQLTDACHNLGFVQIVNHGVPEEALQEIFAMSKRLFDLKLEEKQLAPHPPGPFPHRGYSYPGLEKVYTAPDLENAKESFEVGSEHDEFQPNIWLPEEVLPGFRDVTTLFYWQCHKTTQAIMQALAMGIGLEDIEAISRKHSGNHNQMRLAHYPAVPAEEIESGRKTRLPAHTDWGTMTILFQDDCGGLEVEDPHMEGRYIPAAPVPGALVLNIADLLMRWSNDTLKSTRHRVALPTLADRFEGEQRMTRARYSIPYFCGPHMEEVIGCLAACQSADNPAKYEPIKFGEFVAIKTKSSYVEA